MFEMDKIILVFVGFYSEVSEGLSKKGGKKGGSRIGSTFCKWVLNKMK